jgi:nicotinamidase-related amidase
MAQIPSFDPKTSAVLALDCQKGIIARIPGAARVLAPAARVLTAARARQVPVFHVGLGFRPGYPEVHPEHATFGAVRESGRFVQGTESAEFHEALSPQPGDIAVVKHRVSAFSGNDLEMILRSQGIRQLAFFGIATSGIVLSTLRQAADLDFRCIVVQDCCFDSDEEVHRVLAEKVFPRQALVVESHAFIASILDLPLTDASDPEQN